MTALRPSVIVVSRGRPRHLNRCLAGLAQLEFDIFEVVVVADAESRAGLTGFEDRGIKVVPFEGANISAARNRGIDVSGGEIVCFIDDDAIPEPYWLHHLTKPFSDPAVAAAGGYVLGRNGISLQWGARMVFPDGGAVPLEMANDQPRVFPGTDGRAIKTEGANMAVRRDVLDRVERFDEAFHFYLDETDLNMRLAALGCKTAIVPLAQVHHRFAESPVRRFDRVPLTIFPLGRSQAIFVRKHDNEADPAVHFDDCFQVQRKRLLRMMRDGQMMPGDVGRLLRTFKLGWKEGMSASFGNRRPVFGRTPFQRFTRSKLDEHVSLYGRFWQKKRLKERSRELFNQGKRVTLFRFSYSMLNHRVYFDRFGVWNHVGGQFGKSDRTQRFFTFVSAKNRSKSELSRIKEVRGEARVMA